MAQEAFAWFAGVDWGSERHHACIVDAQGIIAGEREFPHSGAGLAELGDWLLLIAGEASAVAVAIEVPHGPVVDSLIDRGFALYAINPKPLDRLRHRVCFAASKLLIHVSSNCVRGRALRSADQPHASSALAVLPANAEARRRPRCGMASRALDPRTYTEQ